MRTRQILCPTDFSITASHALCYAVEMANLYEVNVELLHVMDSTYDDLYGAKIDEPDALEELVMANATENLSKLKIGAQEELKAGLKIHTEIRRGNVLTEILAEAEKSEVGMIVIANHGAEGVNHFLNAHVTEGLANTAECPVLVVK
ncbi:universal stress protein [Shewanella youngdeokensis]|uniref:Universal stress protein n=1 Tax=Shewanella youngdeokensis TaxID=2999068 RepID=A0ABZ0JZZ6_9GAMM|nr:universal stress protein [Shewanella sp. DAU334]